MVYQEWLCWLALVDFLRNRRHYIDFFFYIYRDILVIFFFCFFCIFHQIVALQLFYSSVFMWVIQKPTNHYFRLSYDRPTTLNLVLSHVIHDFCSLFRSHPTNEIKKAHARTKTHTEAHRDPLKIFHLNLSSFFVSCYSHIHGAR